MKCVFAKNKGGEPGGGGQPPQSCGPSPGGGVSIGRGAVGPGAKSLGREKEITTLKLSFMGRNTTLCCYK